MHGDGKRGVPCRPSMRVHVLSSVGSGVPRPAVQRKESRSNSANHSVSADGPSCSELGGHGKQGCAKGVCHRSAPGTSKDPAGRAGMESRGAIYPVNASSGYLAPRQKFVRAGGRLSLQASRALHRGRGRAVVWSEGGAIRVGVILGSPVLARRRAWPG
jgi:hypothetical protein